MLSLPKDLVVLVVEDCKRLLEALIFEFGEVGVSCLAAQNGEEALAILDTSKVDLVISDVRMPCIDGLQLLKHLRGNGIFIPFVLMSGFTEVPLYEAFSCGADAFLGKPFDVRRFLDQIRRLTISSEQAWSEEQAYPKMSVSFRYRDEAHATSVDGINIGRGGFFLGKIREDYVRDVEISFQIGIIGTGFMLDGVGKIRWIRAKETNALPIGCGIEFSYLTPQARATVLRIILKNRPTAYIPKAPSTEGEGKRLVW